MSDLISRQAAVDALEKIADFFPWKVPGKSDTYDRYNEGWNDAIGRAEMEIETLPSAESEIIQCKDCKHNPKYEWFGCPMSHLSETQRPETAWCWKAERGTDETD